MRTKNTPRYIVMRPGALILVGVFIVMAAVMAAPLYSTSSKSLGTDRTALASALTGKIVAYRSNGIGNRTLWPVSNYLSFPMLPQGPTESIVTYDSTCTNPKTSFDLGERVCAIITGAPLGTDRPAARIAWVTPYGSRAQGADITTDPQTGYYDIPSTAQQTFTDSGGGTLTVDNRGTWRISTTSALDGSLRQSAYFTVHDPATPSVDLSVNQAVTEQESQVTSGSSSVFHIFVTNTGPDAAQTVVLTDDVPGNTTFVAMVQSSGPAFSCSGPAVGGTGTITCTITSLARGDSAAFDLAYNVDASTPTGTVISNTVTISSNTAELVSDDNSSTANARVVGVGTPNPGTCSVGCPDDISTQANTTESGQDGAVVHFSPPSGNEECGPIITDHCNDCFFPVGITTVTGSAATGESCSFTVTVTPPNSGDATIACPANQTADADSNCEANLNAGTATATGSNVTVFATRSDGKPMYDCDVNGTNCTRRATDAPFQAGQTTITWTATSHDLPGPYTSVEDEESHRTGNASCTQTITVNDVTPPTITPPPGQTASADANCQAAVPDFTQTTTVTDNCACASSDESENCVNRQDIVVTQDPAPGTLVGLGTHTITLTANDGSSNNNGAGNSSTAQTTFTVNDTTAPTIDCPDNISIPNTPATCEASVSPGVATATDNCDGNVVPTPSRSDGRPITDPFPVGTTTITWTATDSAGNSSSCDQTVVVLDNENPQITCPDNITTNTDPGSCTANVNPGTATATDNCGDGQPPTVTGSRSDGEPLNAPYPKGTTTIHWTATDSSGNSSSCDQTVTVNDNEAPAISCPANITRSTDPGACSANIDPGTATATDNCGTATVSGTRSDAQPLNAPYPKGTTTITWTATDGSGNQSSCTQTITVNDTEAPAISCPANITTNTEPGTCAAHVVPGTATATDNCDVPTVSGTRSDGRPLTDTYPRGTTTITWTATDSSGNQSSCNQTVTVVDNQAPTITFNGQTPSMWPPNHSYRTFTAANFISSVSDNCDSLSVSDVDIISATSDETENGGGDGNTSNDIVIAANCKSIQLRAERQSSGNGRVYTITFRLRDSSGNTTTGTAKVYSPKNNGNTPVDDGPHYTVTGNCP